MNPISLVLVLVLRYRVVSARLAPMVAGVCIPVTNTSQGALPGRKLGLRPLWHRPVYLCVGTRFVTRSSTNLSHPRHLDLNGY